MIERVLQVADRAIHHGDWIHQAFVVNELRPKEADVPRRGLHMFQLTALEKITPTDAVSDACGARIAGDGPEFVGGFGGEALVGINVENPGMLEGDVA